MIDRFDRALPDADDHSAASPALGDVAAWIARLDARLSGLEDVLAALRDFLEERKTVKESYTTAEAAAILGKRPYTVREWCRLGRIHATKAMCGRGGEVEWRISHEELERFRNEGLLPLPRRYPR
jgi:predicted trehalose synthase